MSYYNPEIAYLLYEFSINGERWSYYAYLSAVECPYGDYFANDILHELIKDHRLSVTFKKPSLYVPPNQRLCKIYRESWEGDEIRLAIREEFRKFPHISAITNIKDALNKCEYVKEYYPIKNLASISNWFTLYHINVLDKYDYRRNFFCFDCQPPYGTIEMHNKAIYTSSNGRLHDIYNSIKNISNINL
jgi:hypothetical protein